ncbi:MAG: trypsin-like peptidase domain-containing protein [Candidatus Sumerlaeia bacterium]|nr:trypsin-like peptidase domain-containing protein [Candidatus Sumerlaeia bacterium]
MASFMLVQQKRILSGLGLAVLLAVAPLAAQVSTLETPRSMPSGFLAGTEAAAVAPPLLALQSNSNLLVESQKQDTAGPLKFAENIKIPLTPDNWGAWETLADGRRRWRATLHSPGAENLNLAFSRFALPVGAELYLSGIADGQLLGPLTALDNQPHGEYWTPLFQGDEVRLELVLPAEEEPLLELELLQLSHGFRPMFDTEKGAANKSGSCNVDVVCPEGNPWRDQINAVGGYSFGGNLFCTGTLINNTALDNRPLFLTAFHCGVTTSNAASIVVYWNYQNSTCRIPGSTASGQAGNGSLTQFNVGSVLRASYQPSDFTLLELEEPVNPQFNPYFAGWDRRDQNHTAPTAIHHPDGDEKRISFTSVTTQITGYLSETVNPSATYLRILDWDLGTTEPGSSGSALFNTERRIIGQLHGGFAACGNDLSDWYGRIASSWTGGGVDRQRLSTWLDPLNTGALTLDGLALADVELIPTAEFNDTALGDGDGIPEPGEQAITFNVVLQNSTSDVIDDVRMDLFVTDSRVEVVSGFSQISRVEPGATQIGLQPFSFSLSHLLPCGTRPSLEVQYSYTRNNQRVQRSQTFALRNTENTAEPCDVVPEFSVSSVRFTDNRGNGNNNAAMEPGESPVTVTVELSNIGGAVVSSVPVTLTTEFEGLNLLRSQTSLPLVAQGGKELLTPAFVVSVSPDFLEEQSPIQAHLEFNYQQLPYSIPFNLFVGRTVTDTVTVTRVVNQAYGDAGFPQVVDVILPVEEFGRVDSFSSSLTTNITHTWVSDNTLSLISPLGTEVILFNGHGGSGDNLTGTTFIESANGSITEGIAPFSGSYRPFERMSKIQAQQAQGDWIFRVKDDVLQDSGTVGNVTLDLVLRRRIYDPLLSFEWAILDPSTEEDVLETGTILNLGRIPLDGTSAFSLSIVNSGEAELMITDLRLPSQLTTTQQLPLFLNGEKSSSVVLLPATEGTPGVYTGTLLLSTNDPERLLVSVPVQFRLGDAPAPGDFWVFE